MATNLNVSKLLDTIAKILEIDPSVRTQLIKNIDILVAHFKNNCVAVYSTLVRVMTKEFGASTQFRKQLLELLTLKD